MIINLFWLSITTAGEGQAVHRNAALWARPAGQARQQTLWINYFNTGRIPGATRPPTGSFTEFPPGDASGRRLLTHRGIVWFMGTRW